MPKWDQTASFTNETGGKTRRYISDCCPGYKVESRRLMRDGKSYEKVHVLIHPDGSETKYLRFGAAADAAERLCGYRK